MMNKRDLVLRALSHQDTRPVPYQLDMTDEIQKRMIKHSGNPRFFEDSGSYLAMERNESFTDLGGGLLRDMFGVVWDRSAQEGDFGIVRDYLLKEPTLSGYTFPEPDEALIREKCERLAKQTDRFTMYDVGFSLFERAWTLRSMPDVLCDMLENEEFLNELLDRIVAYNLRVVDIVADYPVDCIFFGDDWGQQQGLIMGYPLWKKFLYPRLKTMYDHVKSKGMYVSQHSCGDCREVFPDLCELGLDIYNTFQPEVYDIVEFKARFGKQITFFGGISTQRLLPYATPEEVKREMRRIIAILSQDGGYIIAPTHAMPDDIPTENVLAFLDVCRNG